MKQDGFAFSRGVEVMDPGGFVISIGIEKNGAY